MATIQINALNPTGTDLFSDNESYLKELNDSELNQQGGMAWTIVPISISIMVLLREC